MRLRKTQPELGVKTKKHPAPAKNERPTQPGDIFRLYFIKPLRAEPDTQPDERQRHQGQQRNRDQISRAPILPHCSRIALAQGPPDISPDGHSQTQVRESKHPGESDDIKPERVHLRTKITVK